MFLKSWIKKDKEGTPQLKLSINYVNKNIPSFSFYLVFSDRHKEGNTDRKPYTGVETGHIVKIRKEIRTSGTTVYKTYFVIFKRHSSRILPSLSAYFLN